MLFELKDAFGRQWAVNHNKIVAMRKSHQPNEYDIYLDGGLRIQMKGTYDEMYDKIQEGLLRLRKEVGRP